MQHENLTKFGIAERQLFKAIYLFCSKDDPITSITLAGAAEEILGKLAKCAGHTSVLDEEIKGLCELHQTVFGTSANPKEFADIINNPKNELKHLMSGNPVMFDLEEEAVNLIQRGITNYQKLRPNLIITAFIKFDDAAAAWYRKKAEDLIKNIQNEI